MSRYDTNTSHPLIPNSNQYFLEKKYVSIHSEDRNSLKYPDSTAFEVELPQDYLNVQSVRLATWSFPANYNVFSVFNSNVSMTFKFVKLYNPGEHMYVDKLQEAIFAGLYANLDKTYYVIIEPGFYTPDQMSAELTNKFNEVVTNVLSEFFKDNTDYPEATDLFTGYTNFNIVYNSVGQKLWFGNTSDKFSLENEGAIGDQREIIQSQCLRRSVEPSFTSWGLPAFLGFTRCPITASSASELEMSNLAGESVFVNRSNGVPRFYYGDSTGNDGYWLLPTLPGATVYFLQAPLKINFMGPSYIYMEIAGLNCIDETSPYNLSSFTMHTNETNGVVNSAFAKIPVTTTPISQWFDDGMLPYKWFNPPAERIRKLKIKFRYHNGQQVDFGSFDYSFMLEFTLLSPQSLRNTNIKDSATSTTNSTANLK